MNISPYRLLQITRRIAVLVVGLAVLGLAYAWWQLPAAEPEGARTPSPTVAYEWPEATVFEAEEWTVIQGRGGAVQPEMGPLGQRFRLAGTFFAYPGDGDVGRTGTRHAILDDLEQKRQHLLQEGDAVDAVQVVNIYRDRIVLHGPGGEEELWLSFTGRPGAEPEAPTEVAADAETPPMRFEDMPAIETSRFGKRIGENRWVLQRDELTRYFDELQEDPERLTAIFMAMNPDLDAEDQVMGYQLDMLGEDVLYEAAGFQNGDIVRKVNSMPMTSPARAEYFIREFLNERISALVFDIERDGEEQKLIHLIR